MLGSIIGDIVGSRFEFNNVKTKNFKLFSHDCSFTDDTICTIGVMDAILSGGDYGEYIHRWCRKYPHPMGGYGASFLNWVRSDNPQPYNSFGNGAAMRVAPVGMAFSKSHDVIRESMKSAVCSHNHIEGIIGAQCVADTISSIYHMGSIAKNDITSFNREVYYGNAMSAMPGVFDETCQGCVPAALDIVSMSVSFVSAIRNTMIYGGDSDTLGAIVGGIAEAIWGIPEDIKKKALSYLPEEMIDVITKFYNRYGK